MSSSADLARRPAQPRAEAPVRARTALDDAAPVRVLGETAQLLNAGAPVVAQRALAGKLSAPVQRAAEPPNRTGLPDGLKAGIESLSGIAMDDVRVHRNSSAPSQLQAHAYAQGSDIHLAPGQDHHLPHEAWHVVQQKQGRVKATRQMKAGVPINDDAGLEREADAMGARAAGLGRSGGAGPALEPGAAPSAAPVQRYTVAKSGSDTYHISDDDTAAVIDKVNNKVLYATSTRVDQANAELTARIANIRLTKGPTKTHANRSLHKVSPAIDNASVVRNALHADVTPAADPSPATETGVQLPSACEKGAISIIGAYLEDEMEVAQNFGHGRHEHDNARIANLLARSAAGNHQKRAWYDEWDRLHLLTEDAAGLYNGFSRNNRIDPGNELTAVRAEVRKTDADVADVAFAANFKLTPETRYVTRTTRLESAKVLSDMVRVIDANVNALERTIMADVDPNYGILNQRVLTANALKNRLIALYAAESFPKNIIDTAINIAGRGTDHAFYFKQSTSAAGDYSSNLKIFSGSRMKSFLQEIVASITQTITRLEAQRNKAFGAVGNRNKEVDPEIGEAYGIIGGHYDFDRGGRWNWHWASVILKTPTDNVTMEAHASHRQGAELHNERWDFKMYGRPGADGSDGKTFHDIWRTQGFGNAPVTVLGKASVAADPRVRLYHLAGTTAEDIVDYRAKALDLINIETHLQDRSRSKDVIVPYFEERAERIHKIVNEHMPFRFAAERLTPSVERQSRAVASLKNDVLGLVEQFDVEEKVAKAADALVANATSLRETLLVYEYAERKRGRMR